jgi:hypothetical protein
MMLERFGDGIWIAGGPIVAVAGFAYPTQMAVIRLSSGGLFIWSPVALSTELRAAVDALGPVAHIVAPNTLHHAFVGEWRAAYPAARVHAPAELRARRPDLPIDAALGEAADPGWAADIEQVVVRGNRITTEVVFFHRASRTAIFTDLLQQFPRGWFTGWRGWVARLDLMTEPEPTVPRKFRIAFRDKRAGRAALARVAAWPTEKVLMAHGQPVDADGRAAIGRGFHWLLR